MASRVMGDHPTRIDVSDEFRVTPLDLTEVWASDVTYEMSRDARAGETFAAQDVYSQVYQAARPELFFKAPGSRVVGPHDVVGLRRDAIWHVPEPELTVVLGDQGDIMGFTIGNDMTARDLEAANPLYLPQAKMFHHSAAIGPTLVLAGTVDPYQLTITLEIRRKGALVLREAASTQHLSRSIDELVRYLRRAWTVSPWSAIMTGTGIVPPDEFSLEDGDEILITIPEIGTLRNVARTIEPSWAQVVGGMDRILEIDPRDTVAVALRALDQGQEIVVGGRVLWVLNSIPFGHKVALESMKAGSWVIKYGERIGKASQSIEPGQHVHTHNLESDRGRGDLRQNKEV